MNTIRKIMLLMAVVHLVPKFGYTQLAISFDTLGVNHVSLEKLPQCMGAPFDCILMSDVVMQYSFTITNTTDSILTLLYDSLRLGQLHYDGGRWHSQSFKHFWNRLETTRLGQEPQVFPFDTLMLTPHEGISLTTKQNVSYYTLEKVNSAEYVATVAPTTRMYVQLSGYPLALSGHCQHFKIGDKVVNVDTFDCRQLGYQDRLVHNEMLQEYLRENPGLFPSIFSEGCVQEYFLCSLKFANEHYAKLSVPDAVLVR